MAKKYAQPQSYMSSGQGTNKFTMDADAVRVYERAIRDGTHSDKTHHFCSSGNHIVEALYFKESSGGMGTTAATYCRECWWNKYGKHDEVFDPDTGELINAKPKSYYIKSVNPEKFIPTFEEKLLIWSNDHMPKAGNAFFCGGDRLWELKVLAAIYRERAAKEPHWHMWVVVSDNARHIYRLAKYIVRAGGYPIDPNMSYADWVSDIRALEGVEMQRTG